MANRLPRWRGFNLTDMCVWSPGMEEIAPGEAGDIAEADFALVREWGFDWVRIPMDYRLWTAPDEATGSWRFREVALRRIDRYVELGGQYGLHVALNFHRAPGYCVNAPPEPRSLWTDPVMQAMFNSQWHTLAERYRGVDSARLSFDLVNEPPWPGGPGGFTRKNHEAVIRGVVAAIRSADPARLIMANGICCGQDPIKEIADLGPQNVGQSCRGYYPFGISHYQATWVSPVHAQPPKWPGAEHFGMPFWRAELEGCYVPWVKMMNAGVGVHCGECGGFNRTPHEVFLAWFGDVLGILKRHGIGWGLWGIRQGFGVLDSERADVAYEDFRGQKLDRKLLELLRAN